MKTAAEYLRTADRCPACNSTHIESGDCDFNADQIDQEVVCNSCHAEWIDHYGLQAVSLPIERRAK